MTVVCFALQLGIMIHSLVIGFTIAIASGADFESLVIVMLFHQVFKGLLSWHTHHRPSPHRPSHLSWLGPFLPSSLHARHPRAYFLVSTYLVEVTKTASNTGGGAGMKIVQGVLCTISAGRCVHGDACD